MISDAKIKKAATQGTWNGLYNFSMAELRDFTYRIESMARDAQREEDAKICARVEKESVHILGADEEYICGREMGAQICANSIRIMKGIV